MMKKRTNKHFLCQCCFCERDIINMCKCNHGHQICKKCIQNYVHSQMSEGRPSTKCIAVVEGNPCDGYISYDQLLECLGKEAMSEMIKQETINAIHQSNIRDLFVCAHCGYQFSLVNKKAYRIKYCPVCGKGTCVRCGKKEHCGKTCKEAQFRDECEKQGITLCPRCKLEFIKERGCNMLKCPRCTTRFCFKCGQIIPDSVGYRHFSEAKKIPKGKCPLRSYNRNRRKKIEYLDMEERSIDDNAIQEVFAQKQEI